MTISGGKSMTLSLTVRVSEQGSQQTKNSLVKSLVDVKAGIDMVKGAVETLFRAVGDAYEFSRLGAQVDQTAESFERMNSRLGLPIDQLQRLREASGGTISDLKLMSGELTLTAGFSDEVASAFSRAYPQLIETARAAQALNPTLGDMDYMLNSISYGIKTSSQKVLDNLGIIVKAGDAYKAYAEQIGVSTNELTAEQKQLALLNEVLRVGNNLIDQNGGNVNSATDDYARFDANVENLKNSLAQLWREMTSGPVATAALNAEWRAMQATWAAAREEALELNQITEQQNALMYNQVGGLGGFVTVNREQMIAQIELMQEQYRKLTHEIWINDGSAEVHWANQRRRIQIQEIVNENIAEEARAQALATVATEQHTISTEDEHWALMESVYAHVEHYRAVQADKDAALEAAEAADIAAEAQSKWRAELLAMTGDFFTEALPKSDAQDEIEDLRDELDELLRTQGKWVTVTASTEEEINKAALATYDAEVAAAKLAEAQQQLAENTDPEKQRALEGAVLRAQDAYYRAAAGAAELNGELSDGSTYLVDNTTRIDEINTRLDELREQRHWEQFYEIMDAAGASAKELYLVAEASGYYGEEMLLAALKEAEFKEMVEELGQKLQDGEIDIYDAITAMKEFEEQWNNLQTEKTFTMRLKTVGSIPPQWEQNFADEEQTWTDETTRDPDNPDRPRNHPQAAGGDWIVDRPTLFLAGEAGPERAMFQPINSTTNNNQRNPTIIINGGIATRQQAGQLSDQLMGWI